MKTAKVVVAIITFIYSSRLGESANILAIFMHAFSSPYFVVVPYIKALKDNGHNMTLISPMEIVPDIEGVRHIRVSKLDEIIADLYKYDYDDEFFSNKWKEVSLSVSFHYNMTKAVLSNNKVQSLLRDNQENFDMILMEPIYSSALNGFAEHFNASLVGLTAFGSNWLIDYQAGNSAPSGYRPISPVGYSLGSSLLDKWNNWIFIVEEWLLDRLVYVPSQLQLFQRYFHFPAEKYYERRRSYSLMLINQHFSLGRTRSNAPNVIEVAGIHLANQVPEQDKELQKFLDESEDDIIYFSMGLEIPHHWLPNNIEQKLLETFSRLKQRIVWKHEFPATVNRSVNIYFSPQISQQKLLQHPKVKLFITQGGLLSVIEAVNAGVPMLGLPVYFDQFDNIQRMTMIGVARKLDVYTLTVEQLTANIKELLNNPNYALKAKEMSVRFRDQPMRPLESAVWWTEYVLRHNGAAHMRLPERNISFISYYSIHIMSVLCGRIGLCVLGIIILVFSVINVILSMFAKNSHYTPLMSTNDNNIRIGIKVDKKEKIT